jgi:hypothetical protein
MFRTHRGRGCGEIPARKYKCRKSHKEKLVKVSRQQKPIGFVLVAVSYMAVYMGVTHRAGGNNSSDGD